MFKQIFEKLDGYKTYLVGTATIIFGISGLIIGKIDANQAMELVFVGLGMMGLRHGLSKLN